MQVLEKNRTHVKHDTFFPTQENRRSPLTPDSTNRQKKKKRKQERGAHLTNKKKRKERKKGLTSMLFYTRSQCTNTQKPPKKISVF